MRLLQYSSRMPTVGRGAGVAEQGCLLSSCAGNGTGGSNPSLSARFFTRAGNAVVVAGNKGSVRWLALSVP